MALDLPPAIAPAQGISVEESGMVMEHGLLVYKTGKLLPADFVNDAIRRLRDERSHHILGNKK